jgi:hypothetical protein
MASNRPTDPDSPKVFNLNAVKVEAKDHPPFRFTWGPKGQRWEMKHRELIDQLPVYEAAARNQAEATLLSLKAALGDQWEEFRKIPLLPEQMEKLTDAYDEHCGADEGESSGSTDS